jgi:hypothetical protein
MIVSSMNAEVLMLQPASEVRQARRLSATSFLAQLFGLTPDFEEFLI